MAFVRARGVRAVIYLDDITFLCVGINHFEIDWNQKSNFNQILNCELNQISKSFLKFDLKSTISTKNYSIHLSMHYPFCWILSFSNCFLYRKFYKGKNSKIGNDVF